MATDKDSKTQPPTGEGALSLDEMNEGGAQPAPARPRVWLSVPGLVGGYGNAAFDDDGNSTTDVDADLADEILARYKGVGAKVVPAPKKK